MNYKRGNKQTRERCDMCAGQRRRFGENPKYKRLIKPVENDTRQEIAG